jgi:hypothetical protein
MLNQIRSKLLELTGLWVDPSSGGLQRIPALCSEIAEMAARARVIRESDRTLIGRIELLSNQAEARLVECVNIQTRTGAYSTAGVLESSSRVATSGWEG